MPSEHTDVILFAAEKIKPNETFNFLMLRALLRSGGIERDTSKFKNIYADGIDYFKL